MALTRLRIAVGAVGGLIAAMTLQGCGDAVAWTTCAARNAGTCAGISVAFTTHLEKDIKQAVEEKCTELAGDDTAINGNTCETGRATKWYNQRLAAKIAELTGACIEWLNDKPLTEECIQLFRDKYENATSAPGNLTDANFNATLADLDSKEESAVDEFIEEHREDMSDFKKRIIDGMNYLIDDATDTLNGHKSNATLNAMRLYIVADAYQSVGAPRLAIGGSLAMIATGILAVAAAARFCSRRRGFHVVDGGEQAADGSAQHA